MAQGRLDEAAAVMSGELMTGDPAALWKGATLDSRRVEGGELFFALGGAQTDGHRFAAAALDAGAAAAVVEREVDTGAGALIRVPSTLDALHALTRDVRRRLPRRLAAVTGSSGKTTTKELLAAMLARRFEVARSPGNLNNLFGFPLALLAVPESAEWMVAETGMSEPGELARIAELARPDVAVYTNVRAVHLEFFDSVRAIGDAKAELLQGLSADGLVVVNRDDAEVARIGASYRGRRVWYGSGDGVDYRVTRLRPAPDGLGYRFDLHAPGERREVRLPLYGRYNVDNFLAAAAAAHALGVPLDDIAAAAAAAKPAPMRGALHRLSGGVTLVDDSYNSNPDAVERVLESAAELAAERRWAVLGEMLELGPESSEFHRRAGEQAARHGFSPVFAVGAEARPLAAAATAAGAEGRWFEDAESAAEAVAGELRGGDLLVVKGSRGVGLERLVERLRQREEEG